MAKQKIPKVQVPRIRSICRAVHKSSSIWPMLAECESQEAARIISNEIADYRGLVASQVPMRQASVQKLEPMFSACELMSVQLTDLILICVQHENNNDQLLWPGEQGSNGTFALKVLASNLANTLLSIRYLSLLGLDAQAKVLLRWFVELADVTVAISYDHTNFEQYMYCSGEFEQDYKHWRQHLKPAKIRRMLEHLDSEVFGSVCNESVTSEEFINELQNIRSDTYQWLSLYSHANSLAQIISGLYSGGVTEDGILAPNFGGEASEISMPTMYRAALYAWISWTQIFWLLRKKHNLIRLIWEEPRLGWFYYRSEVISKYMKSSHDRMVNAVNDSCGDSF